jgi:hypothetical protein
MQSDGLFFFGVLAFFFILWLSTGGPTKPISFAGPYISPITDVDSVQYGYGDAEAYPGYGSSGGGIWSNIMDIENTLSSLQRDSSEIRAFGEASPARGQVTVSASGVSATDPEQEYVTLYASGSQSVDITGWRLVSGSSGRGARIPEGAALPSRGRVNDTGRIILNPGEEAIVITGESPNGVSFKENMCTGYLEQSQTFYPALQTQCPAPYEEFDRFFTGNELRDQKCYDRVRSTSSCMTPDDDGMSGACLRLIDEYLSYNGCVEKHRNDSRFAGRTWRIYLEYEDRDGDPAELWKPNRDAVKLIDADGKTVDLHTY